MPNEDHKTVRVSQKFLEGHIADVEFLLGCLSPEIKEDMEAWERDSLLRIKANVAYLKRLTKETERVE